MRSFKRWFNDRYWNEPLRQVIKLGYGPGPRYELCGHQWCYRQVTYDHRCYKHQGDP
jgi:hypothetical protein